MLPTDRSHAIFESTLVQIRAYGCRTASRPTPLEKVAGWNAVLVMRSGRFLRRLEGETQLVDVNRAMLFNADQPYSVWHPDRLGDAVTEFVLNSDLLVELVESIDPGHPDPGRHPFRRTAATTTPRDHLFHTAVWRAITSGRHDPLGIEEASIRFVAGMLRRSIAGEAVTPAGPAAGRASTRRAHAELAREACLTLSSRLTDPPSLAELADALDVSPYHLCRVVRASTGSTIHRYLMGLRLKAALDRVMDPTLPLAHVAHDLGFADQAHFSNAFRRAFGRPPGAVRRSVNGAETGDLVRTLADELT